MERETTKIKGLPVPADLVGDDAGAGAETAVERGRSTYAPLRFDGKAWDRVEPAAPTPPPAALRIVTWNVWFGAHRFKERAAALLADLAARRPDVIALQEVTEPLLQLIQREPWVRDEYSLSERSVLDYDVAILSRAPLAQMRTLLLPSDMGRRLCIARLACGLDVATVHLESIPVNGPVRAGQLRIIQPHLAALGEDVVLLGDMNFEPGARHETAALDPSFVDVWPVLHPDNPGYSADSIRNPMRSHGTHRVIQQRIDRVFLRARRWRPTAIALAGTEPIHSDGTFISDHFGLEVELRADAAAADAAAPDAAAPAT